MKEEENIKNLKVNTLKRAANKNQHVKSFAKIFKAAANLPNDIMTYEGPSNSILQVPLSLSTKIVKYSYQHLGGKMGELPDQNKLVAPAAIVHN